MVTAFMVGIVVPPTNVAWASRFSDSSICKSFKDGAGAVNPETPIQTDSVTMFVGLVVVCGLRTVIYKHRTEITLSELLEYGTAWKDKQQKIWNERTCIGDQIEIIRSGWKIQNTYTYGDGGQVTWTAVCD